MKRLVIVIFIIFGAFLTFSLYRTFAYDTSVVEETPSTTDLEYTFKIGNSSIKQITVDSGETKYYDVVLGNPNPAKISYGVYYEMVSPSTKPDGFSIEYTSKSTGDSTGKVDKEGNITLNLVVTNTSSSSVTVKLGTVAGYVNGGELALSSGQEYIPEKVVTASEYVMNLDDGTTGDSGSGVYKVQHSAIPAESSATGEIIPATDDYRYYGASPNNYVCLDKNSDGTCEDKHLYRIIGSIYEENAKSNLLKVIKSTSLVDDNGVKDWSFDCKVSSISTYAADPMNCNSSSNSYDTSTINNLLNDVWWSGGETSYYNNSTSGFKVNFNSTSLSSLAKSKIVSSMFYLGNLGGDESDVNTIYIKERNMIDDETVKSYWRGKIGLLNPSDFGYSSGYDCINRNVFKYGETKCSSRNWLTTSDYKITLTPREIRGNDIFQVSGYVNVFFGSSYSTAVVYPVFYLSKDTIITGGIGSELDPYTVE